MNEDALASARRDPLVRRPAATRRAGLVMQGVAYVGLVATIVGVIAGWRLIGSFERTVGDSLDLTAESLVTLDESLTVAENVTASVDEALASAEESLRAVVVSVERSSAVVGRVDGLVGVVAPSLRSTVTTLENMARVGATIDDVLTQLSEIPFGPDYRPPLPLGDQLDQLSRDLAPVAEALESTEGDLSLFADSTDDLAMRVGELADAVGQVNRDLDQSEALLEAYRERASRAVTITDRADTDLDRDATTSRILLVIVGVAVAVGQVVPFWVGKELLARAREMEAAAAGPVVA